jgi:hypothetical protein
MNETYYRRASNKRSKVAETDMNFLTDLVSYSIMDLENRSISNLPHARFDTNLSRVPVEKIKTSLYNIVKKNLFKVAGTTYEDAVDETLRNYILNAYIPSKNIGQMVLREEK